MSTRTTFLSRLLKKPLAVLALVWLLFVVFCAVFPTALSTIDPLEQDLLAVKQLPSSEHWLGTDALGRDVVSRLVHGAMPTVQGLLLALSVAGVLAISLGVGAGYFRGQFDRWVGQYVDLMMSMPFIITALAVLMVFGRSMASAMLTFGVLASAGTLRTVLSVTLNVREELYIDAARISGLSDASIIMRHVLPRIVGPVVVSLALFAAAAVSTQTGIAFLGLGVIPPAPTWGGMIYEAAASINDFPWLLVPSGGVVALTILTFGLLGDALSDTAAETWSRGGVKRARDLPVLAASAVAIDVDVVLTLRDVTIQTSVAKDSVTAPKVLVKHLSLTLKAGETLGIVGESGSGKTLTALSLLGLLPAGVEVISGEAAVRVGNQSDNISRIPLQDEKKLSALRGKTIAMIFQEPMAALDPCFTVGHHLTEVIRAHSTVSASAAKAQALALLEQVKILDAQDIFKRYPHQISGGMAQRVGIARALALKPAILLADEPTTALDVTVQAEILELIRELTKTHQMAVVLVTHDWGVVADICDRALVLYQGNTMEQASVLDLFERPQHAYTKALLRANPHNVKAGERLPTIADVMNETMRQAK
jgi:peptide/nickel transport system permease protein